MEIWKKFTEGISVEFRLCISEIYLMLGFLVCKWTVIGFLKQNIYRMANMKLSPAYQTILVSMNHCDYQKQANKFSKFPICPWEQSCFLEVHRLKLAKPKELAKDSSLTILNLESRCVGGDWLSRAGTADPKPAVRKTWFSPQEPEKAQESWPRVTLKVEVKVELKTKLCESLFQLNLEALTENRKLVFPPKQHISMSDPGVHVDSRILAAVLCPLLRDL